MFEKSNCRICGKELIGAIENTLATLGKYVFIVSRETPDCNWTKCPGCKKVMCKTCYAEQPRYCCNDGRIIDRERARVALADSNQEVADEILGGS